MRRFLSCLLLMPVLASAAQRTPDDAVSELWRALSNAPGASSDVAALKRLFHPDAFVFGAQYKGDVASVRRTAIADFLISQAKVSGKGFYECEVAREVKIYDRLAVVYSVVESRRDKADVKPLLVGSNSIQLYQAGAEWKILSLYYQVEKPGLPIPLGDGQPGKCLP